MNKMPQYVRLVFQGGLGNQLFQYAVYLFLKNKYKSAEIIPDLRAYRHTEYHCGFEVQKIFSTDFTETINKVENYRPTTTI